MLLERIYDEDLAQASYFIGCQANGTALVVDPRRDVGVYLDLAAKNDMTITAVTETHVHADYLSGTRELAAATDAQIYVSGEGGDEWQYAFEGTRLRDGDEFSLGNIVITAMHTPGHTPEHLSYLVTDGAFADQPGFVLTGDFVFVGDTGRPDLLDEAMGAEDTRYEGARQLFASLRDKFLALPDYVQVLPAHGAGSACGKALGAVPTTTVGYERLFSWWGKHLAADDEQGFVDELLDGQPDAHAYFSRMKRQNVAGPAILGTRGPLPEADTADLAPEVSADSVTFIDTRPVEQVHEASVVNAINLPNPGKIASHGAWAIDPETDTRPIFILADDQDAAEDIRDRLLRVGIDEVSSFVTGIDGLPTTVPQVVRPEDLDSFDAAGVVDVRNKTEHADGHVPGSQQLSAGRVLWHQDELPHSGTFVTYCQTGVRNSVAASTLRRAGHDVAELDGSYAAWSAWKNS
ncbi:MBL fold metallo-hydrolase [Brevibacterium renqingii]|uniref:MBL fold metallo-hydrolase n=1 Tax=Brevibacterium renqingii TaxID=2776916 RepID=UPI001ADF7532|nr:MBL fold metallo-hydrolase [Brevibacterium renqingii]